LSKAKSRAWRIQCVSNQRQLALAWEVYADDHGDRLALNGYGVPPLPTNIVLWVAGGNHFFYPAFYDTQYLLNSKYAAFGNYLKMPALFNCPADRSTITISRTNWSKIRSYAMNSYLGWSTPAGVLTPKYTVFAKMSDLTRPGPAMTFLFQDVMPENLCHPAFVVRMPGDSIDGFYHYPSTLHDWHGVLSFCDGHAEAHRWRDARTRPTVPASVVPPGYGIVAHWTPCPNNADLAWIRERTTSPINHGTPGPFPVPLK